MKHESQSGAKTVLGPEGWSVLEYPDVDVDMPQLPTCGGIDLEELVMITEGSGICR